MSRKRLVLAVGASLFAGAVGWALARQVWPTSTADAASVSLVGAAVGAVLGWIVVSLYSLERRLQGLGSGLQAVKAEQKKAAADRALLGRLAVALDSGLLSRKDVDAIASDMAERVRLETEQSRGELRRLVASELRTALTAPRPAVVEVHEELPRLTWAVKVATPKGSTESFWGDTHFARSVAAALGRRGQSVRVDFRQDHEAAGRTDDVVLTLRGLADFRPGPESINLLWVISHPDEVTAEEVSAYDLVYVASTRPMAFGGRTPIPLLQCSDTTLFRPDPLSFDTGPEVLFVGNSRGVERPVVRDALAAGLDLTIIGKGWSGRVPDSVVARENVPNSGLSPLYSAAGVVLNDHWDDMRRLGLVSNRLFDAACAGARVVSDDVPGVEELFSGLVRCYTTPEQLGELVRSRESAFPPAVERIRIAGEVAASHSFDARAATLVDDAMRVRSARG